MNYHLMPNHKSDKKIIKEKLSLQNSGNFIFDEYSIIIF